MDSFFVTGNPFILGSQIVIAFTIVAILFVLTYFRKWSWLWHEWLTTLEHKRIGIMYLASSFLMLFRGGVDALLMRTQLAFPGMDFLPADHYNQIFTTHGAVMIFFMEMPFLFGLFSIVVPLQLGAREVAFPFLNALSFWLFFWGAMLFNLSFIIGGAPAAGWLAYTPLSELQFSPDIGMNYYILGIGIAEIGTIAAGINFIVTIVKMRAPGMTLMKMPLFLWSVFSSCTAIIFAFPILTVTLFLLFLDRYAGTHFFTLDGGGNPMMYINLIWMWGHPEVYILILPAFGVLSEIVATFSKKKMFGYKAMVISFISVAIYSFIAWVHHFFTMGTGPAVNSFFAVTTLIIAIPTGVKIFNWLFTMYRGRIRFTTPMMWAFGFIFCFVVGGMTGVMLAVVPADFQFHNSYFLIAHFHQVLIGGTVFAYFAGLTYWWPKMFGFTLNEHLGKWAFWLWNIGFYVCFMPQYVLGLDGMTRRIYTYPPDFGWGGLNLISTSGAFLMGAGFLFQLWQIVYSVIHRNRKKDRTGDPWNGRTLEWSIPSPAPLYNFAAIPHVSAVDDWWERKVRRSLGIQNEIQSEPELQPIRMPKNSSIPFIMSLCWFTAGFGFVWKWMFLAIPGLASVAVSMLIRSFSYDTDYYLSIEEIRRTEAALRGEQA